MTVSLPLSEQLNSYLHQVEDDLKRAFAPLRSAPFSEMGRMVDHHFGWLPGEPDRRGKRIRPLLTLEICRAAGGDWVKAVPAASAIEVIHNFSLIHDDIEDRSESRRGRSTLWVEWTLAQALNTGDALLILSQLCALRLRSHSISAESTLAVLEELNRACLQLTFGQHLDLAFEDQPGVTAEQYLEMIAGKTASLIAAAAAVGAMLSSGTTPAQVHQYRQFGLNLGLAFQLQDDILGIWGSPDLTGKPAGDDLALKKKSLPVIIGLNESPEFAGLWASGDPSQQALGDLAELLRATGAFERTRALAEEHTDRALAALAEAGAGPEIQVELRNLAGWLLARKF